MERERISGGDGFLTASQTASRARGEVLELGGKKKKNPIGVPNKRGFNLKNRAVSRSKVGSGSGLEGDDGVLESGQTTPGGGEEEEDDEVDIGEQVVIPIEGRKEVFTCKS